MINVIQHDTAFEDKALTKSIFASERARLSIKTKKGKSVKGKIGDLKISGDKNFKKNIIIVEGLNEENLLNYNSKTNKGEIFIKSFDKSEISVSKLLLKMGIESLFTSQKKYLTIMILQI